ncbi:hypothetical protein BG06_3099 [Bacillus thuringiensis]|uniref:Uncharacterized protein n=1 Tax=Bacillus thuringiensis TaxID=1428 RepID=A0AB33AS24_BACTU|nr:hypothetical protein [Bacillus sp. CD3-1a]AJG74412.1 hypothetical protein BF38_624 [Bacillus thuringiensis]AJH82027.1 hypothetical protein BF36_151 [Bacillus thuringiensis]AJI34162.1 hypothetical protein BG06_3099 [Bacillus thuringiensis]
MPAKQKLEMEIGTATAQLITYIRWFIRLFQ